jgi:DNA-binding transcriptional LysR family regulator
MTGRRPTPRSPEAAPWRSNARRRLRCSPTPLRAELRQAGWRPYRFQRRLATHALGLFAAPSYLAERGTPRTLADLGDHRFVDLDEPYSHYTQSTWLAGRVGREQIVYRSNSLLGLLAATRAGWGIGIHSRFLGNRDGSLVALFPETTIDAFELWLVTHRGLRRTPRIRAAYEFIANLIAGHRDELEGSLPATRDAPWLAPVPNGRKQRLGKKSRRR